MRNVRLVDTLVRLGLRRSLMLHTAHEQGVWLAERLRELGPTYIKIGQFISARNDIFGADFSRPFAQLRDQAPPIDQWQARSIITTTIDSAEIVDVDWEPIAAASIGQVHKATLRGGKMVAVKIKRPGVEQVIIDDISFIARIADVVFLLMDPAVRNIDKLRSGLDDLKTYVLQETDFRREVQNMVRFRAMYADDPFVRVPVPVRRLCADDVIVMEYVESSPLTAYSMAEVPDAEAKRTLANSVMDVFVSQLVHKGLVHGDPHPGNMGVDSSGRLVLYDFGNVVEVSPSERLYMKELIFQLMLGNNDAVIRTLSKLGVTVTDREGVDGYISMYRDYMRTVDIKIIIASVDPEAPLPLQLTDKLMRLFRVYATLEGTCKRVHSKFSYFDLLDNYIDDIFLDEEFFGYKLREGIEQVTGGWFLPQIANDDANKQALWANQTKPSQPRPKDKANVRHNLTSLLHTSTTLLLMFALLMKVH
jgi:predicted unusual protein kinase regulating ubiquinone biosynthesis (AarF/ABC1/UbiB family)